MGILLHVSSWAAPSSQFFSGTMMPICHFGGLGQCLQLHSLRSRWPSLPFLPLLPSLASPLAHSNQGPGQKPTVPPSTFSFPRRGSLVVMETRPAHHPSAFLQGGRQIAGVGVWMMDRYPDKDSRKKCLPPPNTHTHTHKDI